MRDKEESLLMFLVITSLGSLIRLSLEQVPHPCGPPEGHPVLQLFVLMGKTLSKLRIAQVWNHQQLLLNYGSEATIPVILGIFCRKAQTDASQLPMRSIQDQPEDYSSTYIQVLALTISPHPMWET